MGGARQPASSFLFGVSSIPRPSVRACPDRFASKGNVGAEA